MKAKLIQSDSQNDLIKTFWFMAEKNINFTAGQYIGLSIPHNRPDSRGTHRWFTISSSPNDMPQLAVTTKLIAPGSSFKQALRGLEPGDLVTIGDPIGDFVLPKLIQTPLIFVAYDIGITPFHSILSWLNDTNEKRPIQLFYGVPNEDEIIFQDTFQKAKIDPVIVVANPSESWGGERGDLTAKMILGVDDPPSDALIYLSGPEKFMKNLEAEFLTNGVKRHQIVTDFFPGYRTAD